MGSVTEAATREPERIGEATGRYRFGGFLAAFAAGLAFGWFALGWWAFPVRWTDADPSDLAPAWKAEHVRLVVSDFARTGRRDIAETALAPVDATVLAELLAPLAAGADPTLASAAARLVGGSGPAADAGAPAGRADSPAASGAPTVSWQRATRWLAAIALVVAALVLAALTRVALHRPHDDVPGRAGNVAPPGDPSGDHPGDNSGAMPEAGSVPARTGRRPEPDLPPARTESAAARGLPSRVRLDRAFMARYSVDDAIAARQTWLVHGDRERPLASVELRSGRLGAMTTLEVDLTADSPGAIGTDSATLLIVTAHAMADPVLRAALGSRSVLVAEMGRTARLAAADLVLEAEITRSDWGGGAPAAAPVDLELALVVRRAQSRDPGGDPPLPITYRGA